MTATATIFVRLQVVGFHFWPSAPPHRDYLGVRHRHLFHVEVRTQVKHQDREIEFHDLRDAALFVWSDMVAPQGEAGSQSCETMARRIAIELAHSFDRDFTVSVSEDGECGATVELQIDRRS